MPDAALRTHPHRRLSRRDRRRSSTRCSSSCARRASTTSASSRTPTRRRRPRTRLADDVPPEVKSARRERLMDAPAARSSFERNAAARRARLEVLVEGAHPETEHLLVGRHEHPGSRRRRAGPASTTASAAPGRFRAGRDHRDRRLRPGRENRRCRLIDPSAGATGWRSSLATGFGVGLRAVRVRHRSDRFRG